ncbi:MAG: MarR family transcriptional regulator [Clostridia bacterium]|nr:MarR family transcriptional regulator [Clostridia bacterium]
MAKTELKILIGLHRTANEIDRKTARIAAQFGLTLGQFAVLEALYHKGDLTVGQVQKAILSSSGTMPLIVNKLAQQGYLTRKQDENDRRCSILQLTPAGRELIAQVYPLNEEMILRQMDCWTMQEKTTLVTLLQRFGGKYGT